MTGHDDEHEQVHFDNRASNPASGSEEGLAGDLGVSSERTGPQSDDPSTAGSSSHRQAGIEGTGTKGSSLTRTDGTKDTSPTELADQGGAEDVSELFDNEQEQTVVTDRTWEHQDRAVGEPKPDAIEDEKLRRKP